MDKRSAPRQATFRERKKSEGLMQMTVWIPAKAKDEFLEFVKRLNDIFKVK
jgi:hypothetical protein